ncbi:M43 family zinc metalloprotease [Spirosoma oryzicola]|uniref:M43 family zinc metalloprotease n=1 Tax=Spirosoma oryzicola TaxID=2898794 RepID=UPI001E2C5721|nr:fibronectin type III domain-containing protein [Spirosoma oryzicola]UHG93838.1 fibronectin type III domain-containing protein [Spirosoma oryzicola]
MNRIFTGIISWLLLFIFNTQLLAQAPPLPQCGTEDLTPQQIRQLIQQGNMALERKRASGAAFTAITYVPIRPHIIRQSNGSGGFSLASLNQVIAITNSYYLSNGYGIQFYFAGSTPDYIDNDEMYAGYDNQSVDGRDATNALNQYYVSRFTSSGLGGFAYYPANGIYSTRSFILAGNYSSLEDLGNRLIPHELGHNFNLVHTFGQNFGNGTLGSGVTTELVTRGAGANCAIDGDFICDTPADPYNKAGASTIYVNGCPQYDPSSTARDANGQAYSPSITNIMSYYFPCTHDFTPGQYDRMQEALALRQTHTAYSLDAPPTDAPAPSNLRVSLNGSVVTLTWQDNATNEMGYFIERSTSATTGFVPIGGVGPNTTVFVDSKTTVPNHYYYRIRPSNTTTGSISSTIDISISTLTTTVNGNYALLSWPFAGAGITYELQWRAVNTPTWNTVSNLTENRLGLSGLPANTTYEWQVKTTGSNQYEGPVNFTIPCQAPTYPYTYPARISASLTWSTAVPGQSYSLRWRAKNDPNWTVVNNLSASTGYYSLTGLQPSTAYEWQVQGVCLPTVSSDFTPLQSFTTFSCQPPSSLNTTSILSSSAYLYWSNNYYEEGRTSELRYRAVGSADWTVVSSLTATAYSLTGLANNAQYEWQVRNICPGDQQSDFSASSYFTTVCAIPQGLRSSSTATSARLSWYLNGETEKGGSFELQYRAVGNGEWSTIRNISSYNYSLTGLPTNVTYEWRVRQACSVSAQSEYSATASFTTRCNPVTAGNAYVSYVTSISAQFFWYVENEAGTTYEIQYRPLGSSEWTTTISNLTATTSSGNFNVVDLPNNTTFEWQIRTTCSASVSSAFTRGSNFTTQCRTPTNLWNSSTGVSKASLSWLMMGVGVTYDLRYRRVGTADWIVKDNLSSTTIELTGLSGNTPYEWQLRTRCPDGQYSDYSVMATFTTQQCSVPYSITSYDITEKSAILSWYYSSFDSGTRAEIRWRAVGSNNWTTISNLSLNSNGFNTYSLTDLTSSTQYEWQVRILCTPTESSAFSSSTVFQTKAPCDQMYTLKGGNWNDASVWSCGRVPVATDTVHLKHAVVIPPSYQATARSLVFDVAVPVTWSSGARLVLTQ